MERLGAENEKRKKPDLLEIETGSMLFSKRGRMLGRLVSNVPILIQKVVGSSPGPVYTTSMRPE